jgi:polyribonucleotide nucleotidyltransferase
MSHTFTTAIGEHSISLETGKLAGQAGGAVTMRCGDTMIGHSHSLEGTTGGD